MEALLGFRSVHAHGARLKAKPSLREGLNRFDDAMGSGREALVTLRMSVAWGYLEEEATQPLLRRVDGVVAQLYRLANP